MYIKEYLERKVKKKNYFFNYFMLKNNYLPPTVIEDTFTVGSPIETGTD